MSASTASPPERTRGHGDPQRSVDNPWADRAARYGFAIRGLIYGVVGGLVAWIGVTTEHGNRGNTENGPSASGSGALHAIAAAPGGRWVLWALAVGFAAFAFFQVVDTVFHAEKETTTAALWGHRLVAGWGVLLYLLACAYTVELAVSAHPGADHPKHSQQQYAEISARVMHHGVLGRLGVGIVGAILVVSGVGLLRRAVTLNFRDRLDRAQMAAYEWRLAMVLGSIGCLARAVALALVGGFIIAAAVTYQPQDAAGLDGTLRTVAASGYGVALLVPLGLALMCYCGYVWFEARYRKV